MNKGIIVKNSKINKKGVFAGKDFKKGEVVLKWNPKILGKIEIENFKDSQKHYLYKVKGDKYFLMQSPEKFVNHSCEANTRVENNCDVAIRDIKKGEEITTDYGDGNSSVLFMCHCGSKNCRGVIK
jgi:SET domain-containing protein